MLINKGHVHNKYILTLPKAIVRCFPSNMPPAADERREGGIPSISGIVQDQVFVSKMAIVFKYCLAL